MKSIFLSMVFVFTAPLFADQSVEDYFDYLDKYPKLSSYLGDAEQGEIEIILDKQKISAIQKQTGRMVGIVGKDTYWLWINDAVKFPSGKEGVYSRLLSIQSLRGPTGVAVMPILPNGKIALNRNFRHATRSWEYELPRGGVNINETIEEAAMREVKEETGMILENLKLLGHIAPDSGITNAIIPIFLAKTVAQEEAQPEDSEAIAAIEAFSIEEIKKGFIDGYLSAQVNGELCQIPLRDPFLAFAIFQAELQSYSFSVGSEFSSSESKAIQINY